MITLIMEGNYTTLKFEFESSVQTSVDVMKKGYSHWLGYNAPNEFTEKMEIMKCSKALDILVLNCFKQFTGDIEAMVNSFANSKRVRHIDKGELQKKLEEAVEKRIYEHLKAKYVTKIKER